LTRLSKARPSKPGRATLDFPWTATACQDERLPADLFLRPAPEVARALLGARLVSTIDGQRAAGVIVETEAYLGRDDPASHAATRSGLTPRNRAMFGPPGHAYVYRSYGMHWCMNVVTGVVGDPQAVLLRGLDPLEGEDLMKLRRAGRVPLSSGPGRLCEALGVTDALYGHELSRAPLELLRGWEVPDSLIEITGRVGVSAARDWPLRYLVAGSPGVSAARRMETGGSGPESRSAGRLNGPRSTGTFVRPSARARRGRPHRDRSP
jgi:DNA-3-methyladenine glycosylase